MSNNTIRESSTQAEFQIKLGKNGEIKTEIFERRQAGVPNRKNRAESRLILNRSSNRKSVFIVFPVRFLINSKNDPNLNHHQ